MVKPTVGSVVHLHVAGNPNVLAALIARVWTDSMINVAAFNEDGVAFNLTSVKLLQDGEAPDEGSTYAEWMRLDTLETVRDRVQLVHGHLEDLARKLGARLNEPELFTLVKAEPEPVTYGAVPDAPQPDGPQPQPPVDNDHVAEGATQFQFPRPGDALDDAVVQPFVPVPPADHAV